MQAQSKVLIHKCKFNLKSLEVLVNRMEIDWYSKKSLQCQYPPTPASSLLSSIIVLMRKALAKPMRIMVAQLQANQQTSRPVPRPRNRNRNATEPNGLCCYSRKSLSMRRILVRLHTRGGKRKMDCFGCVLHI